MVFFPGFFPRKLEKKVFSFPTILKSKDFMIDIPLISTKLSMLSKLPFLAVCVPSKVIFLLNLPKSFIYFIYVLCGKEIMGSIQAVLDFGNLDYSK